MKTNPLATLAFAASAMKKIDAFTIQSSGRYQYSLGMVGNFPGGLSPPGTMLSEEYLLDAYNQWRAAFGNRSFDPERFEIFKERFVAITDANAAAIEFAAIND